MSKQIKAKAAGAAGNKKMLKSAVIRVKNTPKRKLKEQDDLQLLLGSSNYRKTEQGKHKESINAPITKVVEGRILLIKDTKNDKKNNGAGSSASSNDKRMETRSRSKSYVRNTMNVNQNRGYDNKEKQINQDKHLNMPNNHFDEIVGEAMVSLENSDNVR